MRYVVLVAAAFISAALNGAVFTQAPILGIQPDILLVVMLSFVMVENSLVPMFYMAGASLMMDALFAPAIGYYTLPYVLTGTLTYLIFRKRQFNRYYVPPLVGAGIWVLKDILTAIITAMLGYQINFFGNLIEKTLPAMFFNAAIMFLVYQGVYVLYQFTFMRPRKIASKKDLFL